MSATCLRVTVTVDPEVVGATVRKIKKEYSSVTTEVEPAVVGQMSHGEAEDLTIKIGVGLDRAAEDAEYVAPLIRKAIDCEAWRVLGYKSVSDWSARALWGSACSNRQGEQG